MIKKAKLRSLLMGVVFTLIFTALLGKLYWVQVVDGAELLKQAQDSWIENKVIPAKRGSILDRNGNVLAQDAPSWTVSVNPRLIHQNGVEDEVVAGLGPILHMTDIEKKAKLVALVTKKKQNGDFLLNVEIRSEGWKVDSETADKINKLVKAENLKWCIVLREEPKRYYPSNMTASHLLGYTNREGAAVTGLELWNDDILKGTPGSITYEADSQGNQLPDTKVKYIPASDGDSIKLTIDLNIQNYIEQAMEKVFEQYKPKSMTVIAVDPYSLEVLGLANLPNFNPNNYWDFTDQNVFKNHALISTYEPGSTFKIVTLAGATQEGLFRPENTYQSGRIKVPGTTIRDHNNGQGWGEITFLEGLKRSSNVAFVKLGYEGLQEDRLRKYITDFGFGTKTNIDLQGEHAGDIGFHYASEIATATFGQGVTVTPIQQITAVSAIANGGKLMWPHLVKEIVNQEDPNKVVTSIEPKEIRQVISKKTAQDVRGYLEQVVSDRKIGTGRNAYIEGYRVAGKTGTAQKVIDGKYSEDKWVVSFIGFAPVDNPKIVVCIIVDEPNLHGDSNGASMVSGPLFKEVVTKSLRYMEVPATAKQGATAINWKSEKAIVPELINLSASEAENKLTKKKLKYEIIGNGTKIVKQYPAPEDEIGIEQMIYLLTEDIQKIKFPDLRGKALRDAVEVCSLLEVICKTTGEGYVSSQTVLGTMSNRSVLLKLAPISQLKPE